MIFLLLLNPSTSVETIASADLFHPTAVLRISFLLCEIAYSKASAILLIANRLDVNGRLDQGQVLF